MADGGLILLVGAGPGDPGLLTLAGRAALEQADVVLHDRLVGDEILAMIPPSALLIDVGKHKGDHPVPQDEINDLMIRHARAGKIVVRLKGGDPFLFGRGAEEAAAAVKAGVRCRVIPGVTSAIAAPACAGIPVTHRDWSSSLHILSGHGKNGGAPDIPYRELAKTGGTLVFLMALSTLADVCGNLVAAGLSPRTPAALVENGSRRNQRRLAADLADLPALAREREFVAPSVLIVGAVAGLEPAPAPPRILAVGSAGTAGRLADLLRGRGCDVDAFAAIGMNRLAVAGAFWAEVGRYGWIVLTSRFGVECFFDGLFAANLDVRDIAGVRFAVVGERTGEAFRERGIRPDFVPDEFNGAALGRGLAELVEPGAAVALFRAEAADADLADALRRVGRAFDDIAAYRTVALAPGAAIRAAVAEGAYDVVAFTSSAAVESFAAGVSVGAGCPLAVCIGAKTAAVAVGLGLRAVVSPAATLESMADAVMKRLENP